ncbi:MAG: hypothetical protein WCL18_05580 [bacterium]
MYGKTLPQEFNGQKVGKYTKMDIVRINGGLKDINDHNPQQISEKENREIIKKKNDLEGFRDRSEQIIQDIQKFSVEAKAKLGKRYAPDNTFFAPIDGKIVSVSQLPDTTEGYHEGYRKEARVHRLEITIDDPKS